MIWKFLKQNFLFPEGLNWVQHWVSRIGLNSKMENVYRKGSVLKTAVSLSSSPVGTFPSWRNFARGKQLFSQAAVITVLFNFSGNTISFRSGSGTRNSKLRQVSFPRANNQLNRNHRNPYPEPKSTWHDLSRPSSRVEKTAVILYPLPFSERKKLTQCMLLNMSFLSKKDSFLFANRSTLYPDFVQFPWHNPGDNSPLNLTLLVQGRFQYVFFSEYPGCQRLCLRDLRLRRTWIRPSADFCRPAGQHQSIPPHALKTEPLIPRVVLTKKDMLTCYFLLDIIFHCYSRERN